MELRFDGKVAIVTGGAKGIGRTTALRFLREGGKVAVLDIEKENGDWAAGLRREVGAHVARLLYIEADLVQESQVAASVDRVTATFGTLDILINNVGLGANPSPLESLSLEEWNRFLAINLTSGFLMTRAVLPGMRKRGSGHIVNLTSIAGRGISELSNVHYSAAKAAVIGFTRKLAFEEAPNGILVNAVAPGVVFTERIKARFDVLGAEQRDARLAAIPLRRAATPEEIAAAILFLASDDASYITGAVLDVNGGRFMG